MNLIFNKKEIRTIMVGFRITEEEESEALKIGNKQGVKKIGTICGALVRYALKKIKDERGS